MVRFLLLLCSLLLSFNQTAPVSADENPTIVAVNTTTEDATRNIALQARVTTNLMKGDGSLITDGIFVTEGEAWNVRGAVYSEKDNNAFVVIDLPTPATITAIILQADWNDSYILEGSLNGQEWQKIGYLPKQGYKPGIVTRSTVLNKPITLKQLKIRAGSGDQVISIAEVQLFSSLPKNWEELTQRIHKDTGYTWAPFFSVNRIDRFKEIVVLFSLVIFVFWFANPEKRKTLRPYLLSLSALSFILWTNIFQFHNESFVHRHEYFHYYLGSKYHKELSYTRLYECSLIADVEDRFLKENETRNIRSLVTNRVEKSQEVIKRNPDCKSHFTANRWNEFKKDLTWFRENMKPEEYGKVFNDHGFNATPVWTIAGSFISRITEATTTAINAIGAIDLVLLIIGWIVLFRTFGLESASIAMIFWGCNFIARFAWTGNGMLRADWIVLLMFAFAALKTKRNFLAGFCMAYAGLTRIFPFAAFIGFVIWCFAQLYKSKKLSSFLDQREVYLGFGFGCALLISLSIFNGGGLNTWRDFIANTSKHYNTASTNMIGLKSALTVTPGTFSDDIRDPLMPDPFTDWQILKDKIGSDRAPIHIATIFLSCILLFFASRNLEHWEGAILGLLLASLIRLSNYDYYFLLFIALLTPRSYWNGLILLLGAAISWQIPRMFGDEDRGYFVINLLTLIILYSSVIITYLQTRTANGDSRESQH